MNLQISTEEYLTLKNVINKFEESEVNESSKNGWQTKPPKLQSNDVVSTYYNTTYRYKNLRVRVISKEMMKYNTLIQKMIVVSGSSELRGKILVYKAQITNRGTLKASYEIGETFVIGQVNLKNVTYEVKTLLSGKVLYKAIDEIETSYLKV